MSTVMATVKKRVLPQSFFFLLLPPEPDKRDDSERFIKAGKLVVTDHHWLQHLGKQALFVTGAAQHPDGMGR